MLPHTLSNEAPGAEEEREDAKEHPARSLDQYLQAIHLCRQKIAEQAERAIPQGSGHQLIYFPLCLLKAHECPQQLVQHARSEGEQRVNDPSLPPGAGTPL